MLGGRVLEALTWDENAPCIAAGENKVESHKKAITELFF